MKGSSYHERDYAFGQAMLAIRAALGLTQTVLAETLGVTRRAVGDWEAGAGYPKTQHLKQFVELASRRGAFPIDRQAQAVRELWHSAQQKVPLDELWLAALLAPDPQVA